ncbi:MAG: lytic transglycosylase domain-containing protein [Dokdonella sp.]
MLTVSCIALVFALSGAAHARTIYRCVLDGTVSLATAPDPGAQCFPKQLDDSAAAVPNLWGSMGMVRGTLYQRAENGKTVYSTRNVAGSSKVLAFSVATPAGSPAHAGLGKVGRPRMTEFPHEFKAAAKKTGVDEAWLRAIAHAESAFDANAVSDKGAKGVMQLMPDVIGDYGVHNPFLAGESILAGAKLLKSLAMRYEGDLDLAAAAYNAGAGAVAQYSGVPPYAETQDYVAKVQLLHARYRTAMGLKPLPARLQAAQ